MPDIQTILKQFLWARIEGDGGFSLELALAMRHLLGKGPEFGWWAMEELDLDITVKKLVASNSLPPYPCLGKSLTL